MSAAAGVLMLFVGLFMLWAFSAVLISMLAGLATSAILWLLLNLWRRRQLKKALEQNPALDLEQELLQPPASFYLLTALIIWLGCIAMLATMICLPKSMFSPEQLSLGAGVAFWVASGTLIRLIGNLISVGQPLPDAATTRATGSLAAWLLPMLAIVVLIFFAPNTAGWMVWREEWRGYPSTQLRIPLKVNDAEHQQALLKLVKPLLDQGSHVLSHTARSRSGSSYTLRAAVPARYRFHDGALELQLGSVMLSQQLAPHLMVLNAVAEGEAAGDSLPIAWAQCQPTLRRIQRQRFLGAGRDVMQGVQACAQERQTTLNAILPLLQGNLEKTQPLITWFSPWRSPGRWQAVQLPDEDDLDQLDSL